MIKFHKVSYNQFKKDILSYPLEIEEDLIKEIYDNLKPPKRATKGSAGYDFFAPFAFELSAGQTISFPTGFSVEMDDDKVLLLFPRSGLGFKYRLQLDNTIGVIDADYYGNETNGGHIGAKLTNDSKSKRKVKVHCGEAYMQGVFVQFFKTDDDDTDGERHGGFGSTTCLNPKNQA